MSRYSIAIALNKKKKKNRQRSTCTDRSSNKPASKYLAAVKYKMSFDKKYCGPRPHNKWSSYTIENIRYTWIVLDIRNGKILCETSDTFFSGRTKYVLHSPIEWKNHSDCTKWIESGCIGELQGSLSNLHVRFHNKLVTLFRKDYF